MALLFVVFAVFGVVPLCAQLLAIVLYRSASLDRLKKRTAWLARRFPLFVCFDMFAQETERTLVAFRWRYQLKKDGAVVETGTLPDTSELSVFLESGALENRATVESLAAFLVSSIETTQEFDELALLLLSKERPPLPSSATGSFRHAEFMQAPFRERVVMTYRVDP